MISMGILLLQFEAGEMPEAIGPTGFASYTANGIAEGTSVGRPLTVCAQRNDGSACIFTVMTGIETSDEVRYSRTAASCHMC
jgi:aconitase A